MSMAASSSCSWTSASAEDLEARLVGVVHEEERDAVVVGEIAERDVLLVAAEISEADEIGAKDVDEAGRASAMLDVGPAGLGDGGHVEAVAESEEVLLVGAELVVAGERSLHALVLAAAAVFGLTFFDAGQ